MNFQCSPPLQGLDERLFASVEPATLTAPSLEEFDVEVAERIGLSAQTLATPSVLQLLTAQQPSAGCRPSAQAYAGHQFGRFNPLLGDGRVAQLCDVQTADGGWEISIKGIGKTRFSRDLDGRAGLSECLQEFQLTRQLKALGVPVVDCLAVISGNEQVYRQGFERAAMLLRVARSHIRFGTFEYAYFLRRADVLHNLCDFVIERHFSQYLDAQGDRYFLFLREVVRRTAQLIACWQAVGFVHGMMNTDNQSIVGVTLDLGEASFNSARDPDYVSTTLDEHRRYAFGQQPVIGLWNCNVLARALSPLISAVRLREALRDYEAEYLRHLEQLSHSQAGELSARNAQPPP